MIRYKYVKFKGHVLIINKMMGYNLWILGGCAGQF